MNKTQKEYRKTVLKQTAKFMKLMVEAREMSARIPLPELDIDQLRFEVRLSGSCDIYVPFSPDNVRSLYQAMESAGWRTYKTAAEVIALVKSNEDTMPILGWIHEDYPETLYTWVSLFTAGASCKRVKIGTKMVEQPIYDIVCKEGAEEMEETTK